MTLLYLTYQKYRNYTKLKTCSRKINFFKLKKAFRHLITNMKDFVKDK
jgi:hypothetical protein